MEKIHSCQSCGMSIDNGVYCQFCVNEDGSLQSFEERFERMLQWTLKEEKSLTRDEAENKTKAYMRTMPAWKDHPRLQS